MYPWDNHCIQSTHKHDLSFAMNIHNAFMILLKYSIYDAYQIEHRNNTKISFATKLWSTYYKKWLLSKRRYSNSIDARNMSSFMKYLTNVKKGQPQQIQNARLSSLCVLEKRWYLPIIFCFLKRIIFCHHTMLFRVYWIYCKQTKPLL